jgi:GT2 family glycosyltransferase
LSQCLEALTPLPPDSELILAADGPVDNCAPLARLHGARVVLVQGPSGPAVARNAAAARAGGDILVFVDADVAVSGEALSRMRCEFADRPDIAAIFGAYDDRPADARFMSQYKNLSHAFVHGASPRSARTFWAGFGAVRRNAFERIGGFDERFCRPSVEDIDLGYRLTAASLKVRLDPELTVSHLKRWTFISAMVSDVRDRGVPWTQLLWRYHAPHDDLNLRAEYRWSVLLAYVSVGVLVLAWQDARFLVAAGVLLAATSALNHRYHRFFYDKRGMWFASRVWLLRLIQDLLNGVSFVVGTCLFCARRCGVRLPGALPTDPWTGAVRE